MFFYTIQSQRKGLTTRINDQVKLRYVLPHLAFHLLVHKELQLVPALGPAAHLQILHLLSTIC